MCNHGCVYICRQPCQKRALPPRRHHTSVPWGGRLGMDRAANRSVAGQTRQQHFWASLLVLSSWPVFILRIFFIHSLRISYMPPVCLTILGNCSSQLLPDPPNSPTSSLSYFFSRLNFLVPMTKYLTRCNLKEKVSFDLQFKGTRSIMMREGTRGCWSCGIHSSEVGSRQESGLYCQNLSSCPTPVTLFLQRSPTS